MKVGATSRWALALIVSFLALGVWLEGADARRDAVLYAELASASFLLARSEAYLTPSGSATSDEHRQAFRALLTPDGRELFESLIHLSPVAQRAVIDNRDEVFARRITEVVHELEVSLGGDDFSVFVFIGTAHVPGVTRRVREALGIDTDGEPLDLDAAVSRALARVDPEAEASVRSQLHELVNDGVVDVDIGPVRIRGDLHSPYLGWARMMDGRTLAGLVTVTEKEYPRSIQR
jgi:hypothetical protein